MKPSQWIITAISAFLMFGSGLLPPLFGINPIGMSIIGIFIGTMLLLLFVNLAWPLFLCILAYAMAGVYKLDQAIVLSLGNPVFWLVLMSGLLISVLNECGVIKRVAIYFLSIESVRKNPWLFVGTLFLLTLAIGSIMDPTALIVVMVALTDEILVTLGIKKGERFGELIMLGILVFVGLSYGTTPVGHPVPVVMMSMFEDIAPMNFLQYSIPGYITHLIFFVLVMLSMKFIFRLDVSRITNTDLSSIKEGLPPLDKKAKVSALTYLVVVVLWLTPNLLRGVLPEVATFISGLGNNGPLVAGVVAMCLIRIKGEPVMDLVKQIKVGAPWLGCFPVATALLMGSSLNNKEFGLIALVSESATPYLANMSPTVFVFLVCLLCTLLTNVSSNMVTATICATISIALIRSGAIVGVNPGALCFCIAATSSLAFTTQPGSSYAAMVSSTGWVRSSKQILNGGFFSFLAMVMTATVGYWIGCLVF